MPRPVRNQLSGSIPPELGNLTNLQYLDLYCNQLSGSIPPELGNLANLQDLYLYSNQLSGSIPPELGNLANLQYLDLYVNQLSGSIPPELGNLANLQRLFLSSNPLSGSLPQDLTKLVLTSFGYDNTLLCEPGGTAFESWLWDPGFVPQRHYLYFERHHQRPGHRNHRNRLYFYGGSQPDFGHCAHHLHVGSHRPGGGHSRQR